MTVCPGPPLHSCLQLVELKESARILVDLAATSNGLASRQDHTFTDLKDIMETWRCATQGQALNASLATCSISRPWLLLACNSVGIKVRRT